MSTSDCLPVAAVLAPHPPGTAAAPMICTACNWAPHDVAVHGRTCPKGHPLAIVGQTANGSCKRCRADRAMRHYLAHREQENARSRRYHWSHRAEVLARKRARRGRSATPGADHPWRLDASPEAPGETTGPSTGGRSVAGPQATAGALGSAPATCPTCMGLGCNDCCHTGR